MLVTPVDSVLDELPRLVTRLLAAIAVVATVTELRHEQEAVMSYLVHAVGVVVLFVVGRFVAMQIVMYGRRRRIVAHRTLLVDAADDERLIDTIRCCPDHQQPVANHPDPRQPDDWGLIEGRRPR